VTLVTYPGGQRVQTPMTPEPMGFFVHQQTPVEDGLRYAFRLPDGRELPDPASRWQPEGVHKASAVFFPDRFAWSDAAWRGIPREELVIYELHVGTFTPQGTFDAIIPRLEQLASLGITALELMPVAQFPGDRNWGYDGVHPYAVQNSYGGPQGLMRLVDAAHQAGLAVILDVVYNHLGPEGNYLGAFGHYFTSRYHTPWGDAVNFDGPHSDAVRQFVIDNACTWIRDFHLDGLRLDAVHAIFDFSARHILEELQAAVHEQAGRRNCRVHVIAESNQNDVRLIRPVSAGGYGLDGVWSDDFHHAVHALLTGESDGYYQDFGRPEQVAKAFNQVFVNDGCYSRFRARRHGSRVGDADRTRFVVCVQNHDQIGNRPLSDRLSTIVAHEAQRLACGLLLLSPCVPLLFMGQEYGETRPFPFFCSFLDPGLAEAVRKGRREEFAALAFRWSELVADPQDPATLDSAKLSWRWPADSPQAGLRRLHADLLKARRQWPALRDGGQTSARLAGNGTSPTREPAPQPGASLALRAGVDGASSNREQHTPLFPSILILERGAGDASLLAWANLSPTPQWLADFELGQRRPLLSTEARRYSGLRDPQRPPQHLLPFELLIAGPAEWQR
jgi:maltooligosyltrehalose trehalohydrolase